MVVAVRDFDGTAPPMLRACPEAALHLNRTAFDRILCGLEREIPFEVAVGSCRTRRSRGPLLGIGHGSPYPSGPVTTRTGKVLEPMLSA